jgi:hypothetical protein
MDEGRWYRFRQSQTHVNKGSHFILGSGESVAVPFWEIPFGITTTAAYLAHVSLTLGTGM